MCVCVCVLTQSHNSVYFGQLSSHGVLTVTEVEAESGGRHSNCSEADGGTHINDGCKWHITHSNTDCLTMVMTGCWQAADRDTGATGNVAATVQTPTDDVRDRDFQHLLEHLSNTRPAGQMRPTKLFSLDLKNKWIFNQKSEAMCQWHIWDSSLVGRERWITGRSLENIVPTSVKKFSQSQREITFCKMVDITCSNLAVITVCTVSPLEPGQHNNKTHFENHGHMVSVFYGVEWWVICFACHDFGF